MQNAEGRRQKAEGRRQKAGIFFIYDFLFFFHHFPLAIFIDHLVSRLEIRQQQEKTSHQR